MDMSGNLCAVNTTTKRAETIHFDVWTVDIANAWRTLVFVVVARANKW